MGRPRTVNADLPPGLHRKGRYYYFGRKMEALGPDLTAALREWARRTGQEITEAATFSDAARHYRIHALHKLAPKTQQEYTRQLARLEMVFGKMPLDAIKPKDVRKYLADSAPIAGTREKALLSSIFNHARGHGLTDVPNPCAGIRGTKSRSKVYVSDADLAAVLAVSDPVLSAFLELCWRTGQDASVVLGFTPQDVQAGTLRTVRPKTGEIIHLQIEPGIARLIAQLNTGTRKPHLHTLRRRFWAARQQAGVSFAIKQLRAKAATDAANLEAANRLLGHADESTTSIYRRKVGGRTATPITRSLLG